MPAVIEVYRLREPPVGMAMTLLRRHGGGRSSAAGRGGRGGWLTRRSGRTPSAKYLTGENDREHHHA
jgi:hypothetical protein